jgi:hypothetical protein
LLHVLAECLVFMAVSAFLASVLVYTLLHLVVETSLTLLQLCKLIFANDLTSFFVKVSLFIIFCQLKWSDLALEHL